MIRLNRLMPFLIVAASCTVAQAQVTFRPGFMYLSEARKQGAAGDTESHILGEVDVGFIFPIEVYGGVTYAVDKYTNTTGNTTSTADRTSLGITTGWTFANATGPFVLGTYYLESKEVTNTGLTYQGKGFKFDLGYKVGMGKASLGIQLSYKSFEYKEYLSGPTTYTLTTPLTRESVDPLFTIWFPL